MSEQVQKEIANVQGIFLATEAALEIDWDQKNNLQFPKLLEMVAKRLNADVSTHVEIDSYIRNFVRKHPKYYVSRGAGGGIMLRSVYEAKQAEKAKAAAAKNAVKAQIDSKLVVASAPVSSND